MGKISWGAILTTTGAGATSGLMEASFSRENIAPLEADDRSKGLGDRSSSLPGLYAPERGEHGYRPPN